MLKPISFWKLIKDSKKIVIPTIQRDYAQGRIGKEVVRENFLAALIKPLINEKDKLTMDFIYGVDGDSRFIPLDGQQRLTTLWLLHWYIAYKAGVLSEVRNIISRFSYETRISSSQFCFELCNLAPTPENFKGRLRDWIQQQTWFFWQYKQNPTIIGMLNMISGTDLEIKDGIDYKDSLEEVLSNCDYLCLWKRLTETNCLSFYKLKISSQDSDEIYVKMNARGRQLTDFENFKAELVEHVKKLEGCGDDYAIQFAAKMDVDWTDIFWPKRYKNEKTEDVSIDLSYFTFIRRFIYNECLRNFKNDETKELVTNIFQDYNRFDVYKKAITSDVVIKLEKTLDGIRNAGAFDSSYKWAKFSFIPEYKNENTIIDINGGGQYAFYAYCKYFETGNFDPGSFDQWKRVVWNICENRIDDNNNRANLLHLFDDLAQHSHNIIEYLAGPDIAWSNNKEQLLEEQKKARKLRDYPQIIDAETYSFFTGAIRFLFTDSEGNEDWSSFDQKFNNVKKLIPLLKADRHTIKELTPYIDDNGLKNIYYNNYISNNDSDLRAILLNKSSIAYIHNFLLQKNEKKYKSSLNDDIVAICELAFGGRGYLQIYWTNESPYIWTNYEKRSGYYQWESIVIGNPPYEKVTGLIVSDESGYFTIQDNQHDRFIGKKRKGTFLDFRYKDECNLRLYGNNTICLMKDNWDEKVENPTNNLGYYFEIEQIHTIDDLIVKIENLRNSIV